MPAKIREMSEYLNLIYMNRVLYGVSPVDKESHGVPTPFHKPVSTKVRAIDIRLKFKRDVLFRVL